MDINKDKKILRIAKHIFSLLKNKYSNETLQMIGITQNNIIYILNNKLSLLKHESGIRKVFNIIDSVIQRKLNGPDTPLTDLNISHNRNDKEVEIPYSDYVNNKHSYINIIEENDNNSNDISNIVSDMGNVLNISQPTNNIHTNMNQVENIFLDNNKELYLIIDSKDRDINKYKYANDFEIDLKNKNITNISSIELLEVVLLNTEDAVMSSDNLNKPPYLLLELTNVNNDNNNIITLNNNNITQDNTLDNNSETINKNNKLANVFTILTNYESQNNYKYYKHINIKQKYKQAINIDKIGIKFYLPNGELFNFGNDANDSIYTVSLLVFKLHKNN